MGALAGLSADTTLDCVLFKLTTTRTRCEVYGIANGLSDKLFTGLLRPFVSHIRAAQEQIDDGAHTIKLEPMKEYRDSKSSFGSNGGRDTRPCSWFTRGTVDRVIRFVTSPNLLERIIAIDLELAQLDEVIQVSLEEGYYASDKVYQRMEASISDCYEGGSISSSGHGPSSPASRAISPGRPQRKGSRGCSSPEVELEETGELSRQRRKAHEFRQNLLRREQGLAFARATAAGFIQESMPALAAFADCFGAARLREACAKFSALSRRKVNGAVESMRLPSCADSVVGQVGSHSVAGDEDTDFSDSRSDSGSSPPGLGIAAQTETDFLLQDSSLQSRQLSPGDAMHMANNGHVHNMHSAGPSPARDFMASSGHESQHAVVDAHLSHGNPGQLNTAGYHRPVAGIPVNSVGSPVQPFMFQAGHPGSMLMQGGGHYAYAMGNSDGSLTMMQSPDHHSPNGSPYVILPYMGSPPTGRKLHRQSDVGGYHDGQISPNQAISSSERRSSSASPPKTGSKKSQVKWRAAGRKVSSMRRVVVIKKIHVMQQQSGNSLKSAAHETYIDDNGELDDEEEEKTINNLKYNPKGNGSEVNSARQDGRMINNHSLLHLVNNGKVGKSKSIQMGLNAHVALADVKLEDTGVFPGALQDEIATSLVTEHIPFADEVTVMSTAAVVVGTEGKRGTASKDADFEEPDMFFSESRHVRSTSSDDHQTFLWEDELRGPVENCHVPEQPDSHEEPDHGFPVVEPVLFPASTSPKRQRVGLAMQEEDFRGPEEVIAVGEPMGPNVYNHPYLPMAADSSTLTGVESWQWDLGNHLHEEELRGPEVFLETKPGIDSQEVDFVMDTLKPGTSNLRKSHTNMLEDEIWGSGHKLGHAETIEVKANERQLSDSYDEEFLYGQVAEYGERSGRHMFEGELRGDSLDAQCGPANEQKDPQQGGSSGLSGVEGNLGLDWEDPAGSSIRYDTLAGRAEIREDNFLGHWEQTPARNLGRDAEEQTTHKVSHNDVSEKSVKSKKGGPAMYGMASRGTVPGKPRQLGTRNPENQIVAEAQQRAQDRLRIRQVEAAKRREDEKRKQEDARRQRLGRIAAKVGALNMSSNDSSISNARASRGLTPERVPRLPSPSSRVSPRPSTSHSLSSKSGFSTPVLSRPKPTTPRSPSPQLQYSKSGSATPVSLPSASRNGRQMLESRSGPLHSKSLTISAENLKLHRVVSSPSRRLLSPTAATLHREASVVDPPKKDVLTALRKRRASDPGALLKTSSIPSKAVPEKSVVESGQEDTSVSSNLVEEIVKPDLLPPTMSGQSITEGSLVKLGGSSVGKTIEETENGLVETVEASQEVTSNLLVPTGSNECCEGERDSGDLKVCSNVQDNESETVTVVSEIPESQASPAVHERDERSPTVDVERVAQTLASEHESDLEAKEGTPKRRGWAGDFSERKGVEKVSRESKSKVAPVISLPEDDMELNGVAGGNSFPEQWKEWGVNKEFNSEDNHVGYLEEATSPGEVGAQSQRRKSEASGQRKSGLRKLFGFGRRGTAHSSTET